MHAAVGLQRAADLGRLSVRESTRRAPPLDVHRGDRQMRTQSNIAIKRQPLNQAADSPSQLALPLLLSGVSRRHRIHRSLR